MLVREREGFSECDVAIGPTMNESTSDSTSDISHTLNILMYSETHCAHSPYRITHPSQI